MITPKIFQESISLPLDSLTYGYSNLKLRFIATREQVEKMKDFKEYFSIEVSNHTQEEVSFDKIVLVTEDQVFIKKFIELGLQDENLYYSLDFEEYED